MLLITGSRGQLGRTLADLLPEALAVGRERLDIADEKAVFEFVGDNRVDMIVNCAAYTAVDRAEDEPEAAEAANAAGPANLAKSGAAIIHISTDYVFDGASGIPYTEDMPTRPASVYGKTKLAGEQAVLEHAENAVVIRTGWLYSPHGNNFLKTMLRLGAERSALNVVFDQVGTPTYARDLAMAIAAIIPRMSVATRGVYHFANEGVSSWYDFAWEIMRSSGLPCDVRPIESRDYPAKAPRPGYSVLNKGKIKSAFGLTIPHWKDGLLDCLGRVTPA